MNCPRLAKVLLCSVLILSAVYAVASEENFILIDGKTNVSVSEFGPSVHIMRTPCSTFKIVLSLIGFDSGVLEDECSPTWEFQPGYDDFLETWKNPQRPQTWIKTSCIWYSQVLVLQLGLDKVHHYLASLSYGNQDLSGGLTQAWVNSSLKVSPKGQVEFIQSMLLGHLPISSRSVQMTKKLLFVDTLCDGWKLFGKTGWSGSSCQEDGFQIGWFVGWIENEHAFFPFAYQIRDRDIALSQRVPRVKQLLMDSGVMSPSP